MDHTEALQLERAFDAFDAITTERGWGQPPLLLRIQDGLDPDGGAELGVGELDGHPAEALLGFTAPMAWTAMGVSAEGWATSCADVPHGYRAEAPAGTTRERVRTLVLLSHWGDPVGRTRWEDGRSLDEPPTEGFVVDCLRRALGRPTPPPTATTTTLFATMWLENVLARSRQGGRRLSWDQAAALHPAVQLMGGERREVGHEPVDVTGPALALGKVCDWSMVRQQAIRGWKAGLDAPLAVWMDTGMLSRWLLDRRPLVEELIDQLGGTCSPSVLRRIRQSLAAQEVDGGAAQGPGEPDVA